MSTEREAIVKAVAATFREIASWGGIPSAEEALDVAQAIESGDIGGPDDWCCPVCQEVTCDEDCPLAPVRGAGTENPND